ncbi:MAG: site-2 protease family protein [Proteobacteria bacterium]|nr:MAG: site-2 protease family protein [Pseudomonadota bacterium]PIE65432.1 MAG: site-2 protease family protein [Desulfobacterales bacterium]
MNISIPELIIQIPTLLLALTFHEFAHGYVAYRLGDPTAYNQGRLSLNPLRHLDPIGTLVFIVAKFGWAKPVPVNPFYFKNPRKDMLWVALAGPAANLLLAVISAVLIKIIFIVVTIMPTIQMVNAIVIPFYLMLEASVWINLILCVFNFLPIPPLDGSRIIFGLLPEKMARIYASYERYGFIIVLLLAFSGTLWIVINPIINFAHSLLI